jgi:hypothetical protein
MKKAISIFKYLLEFCVPLLLSIAIDSLSNTSYWHVSEYIFAMQILYFIILFIEWIRRFLLAISDFPNILFFYETFNFIPL